MIPMMMMLMMMMIRYEIVVMLEGVVEQTGNSIQVNIAGSDASTLVRGFSGGNIILTNRH